VQCHVKRPVSRKQTSTNTITLLFSFSRCHSLPPKFLPNTPESKRRNFILLYKNLRTRICSCTIRPTRHERRAFQSEDALTFLHTCRTGVSTWVGGLAAGNIHAMPDIDEPCITLLSHCPLESLVRTRMVWREIGSRQRRNNRKRTSE
jgi:hypothetical protein